MADIDFTWRGDKWRQLILEKAAPKALTNVSIRIVNDAKRAAPVDLGNLRRALSFFLEQAREIAAYIGFSEGNANAFKYAMARERGRLAGQQPPAQALEGWVKRKLGIVGAAIKRVAFLVARKIGQKGSPAANSGQGFLIPAFTRHERTVNDELAKVIQSMSGELPK